MPSGAVNKTLTLNMLCKCATSVCNPAITEGIGQCMFASRLPISGLTFIPRETPVPYAASALRWMTGLWAKEKAIVFTVGCWLFIVLAKNLAMPLMETGSWYRSPTIDLLQLLEWAALLSVALAFISKVPYLGTVVTMLGITAILLLLVEAACLALYHYDQRPRSEAELMQEAARAPQESRPSWWQGLFAKEEAPEEEPLPLAPPHELPASALGVNELPTDFEQIKDPAAPTFRNDHIDWNAWQKEDADMGYVNLPDAHVEMRSWSYGVPNPTAFYTMDSLGRRVNGNAIQGRRPRYALFLGCSVTFGVLVDNTQTLPSIVERIDTTVRSYNYGVSGYGTHHLLALLKGRDLRKEVTEPDGAAFYLYFPDHVNRAIGDMNTYLSWNATGPFFYLDGDSVVRNGDFKEGRKLVSWFYEFLPTTCIGKYFDIRLPGNRMAHHYRFAARLMLEAQREYQRQFGNDQFYVVLTPGWDEGIEPYLEELGVRHLDYQRMVYYWQERYHFQGDGHPRPLFYKIVAEQLVNDVLAPQKAAQ